MWKPKLIGTTMSRGGWQGCTCRRWVASPTNPRALGSSKRWSLEAYKVGLETKQNLASRSGAAASNSADELGLEGRRSELPWP